MRNIILLFIILLFCSERLSAQNRKKTTFLKRERTCQVISIKNFTSSLKKEKKTAAFQLFKCRSFQPKFSVELLEGKGIHLMSISDLGPLPDLSVGARFKAGFIITI